MHTEPLERFAYAAFPPDGAAPRGLVVHFMGLGSQWQAREGDGPHGLEREGAAAAATVAAEGPAPGEEFESQATSDDVRRAVSSLPEGPRQVLLMRVEGELSFREIAAELAIPLGTALTWMRSATLKLRKMLGGEK